VTADFFEAGGRSFLAAVRLSVLIEETFGMKWPLATFMTAGTLEEQAVKIREQCIEADWPVLVPIRQIGSKPPLFCVHLSDGHILSYRDLLQHLPSDQPLYGLQSRGLDGISPINTRIEDMARDYVAEIRKTYPRGPYAICGWSFGGTVAFEIARQLEQQQQRVALLALFDTGADRRMLGCARRFRRRTSRVPVYISRVWAAIRASFRRDRHKAVERPGEARLWQALAMGHHRGGRLPATLETIVKANRKALYDYIPREYGGRMIVFKATQRRSQRPRDPLLGWGPLSVGGVEIYEVAGTHLTLVFEPHARTLAEKLAQCLDRAWAGAEASPGVPTGTDRDGDESALPEHIFENPSSPVRQSGAPAL
jgi:thioesterase domain-containing protein